MNANPPSEGGPLSSPGFWLKRAAYDWLAALEARLTPYDLTSTQFTLLAATNWLTRGEHGCSQQEIADFAGSDRATASRVLRGLEARGLVERVADSQSARSLLVRTTPEGFALAVEVAPLARATDREFFGSVDDVPTLRNQLRGLADRRGTQPEPG
jgi:DNA-binding MarR family transcriptional regulator